MAWRIGLPGLGKCGLFGDATIDRLRKMRGGEPSRPFYKEKGVLKGKKGSRGCLEGIMIALLGTLQSCFVLPRGARAFSLATGRGLHAWGFPEGCKWETISRPWQANKKGLVCTQKAKASAHFVNVTEESLSEQMGRFVAHYHTALEQNATKTELPNFLPQIFVYCSSTKYPGWFVNELS